MALGTGFGDGTVEVSSQTGEIERETLEFRLPVGRAWRVLAPRGAGLEAVRAWRPVGDGATVPWFVLLYDGANTFGFGVKALPRAMCSWRVEPGRVALQLDLRSGGRPLAIGRRSIAACEVVRCESAPGESPWRTGRRLCATMCQSPRPLPEGPLFGFNDWYCAYGSQTAENFLADAEAVLRCTAAATDGAAAGVRPFAVLDDGWQRYPPPEVERLTGVFESGWGPWEAQSPAFGMDMAEVCRRVEAVGARPGVWYRPLCMEGRLCDPTDPATLDRVRADMARFREWGFRLVKADFLTYDACGHYRGWDAAGRLVPEGVAWRDRGKTTAEALADLHRAMREAAGDGMAILGCNGEPHLCAGLFEASRAGSDTSGKNWEQTRRNGPNAVAFGGLLHGSFFAADPDCAGLASVGAIPWEKNRQWIGLLARSAMPLFVSWRRALLSSEVRDSLRDAFARAAASAGAEPPEPLDWLDSPSPSRWLAPGGEVLEFRW